MRRPLEWIPFSLGILFLVLAALVFIFDKPLAGGIWMLSLAAWLFYSAYHPRGSERWKDEARWSRARFLALVPWLAGMAGIIWIVGRQGELTTRFPYVILTAISLYLLCLTWLIHSPWFDRLHGDEGRQPPQGGDDYAGRMEA